MCIRDRICAEEFPEAVQELYGLADGLSLPREALAGQIFCIYKYPPFQGCTCFAARSGAGVLLGRNSDFMIQMEGHCLSLEYRSAAGFCFWGNATAPVQLEMCIRARRSALAERRRDAGPHPESAGLDPPSDRAGRGRSLLFAGV